MTITISNISLTIDPLQQIVVPSGGVTYGGSVPVLSGTRVQIVTAPPGGVVYGGPVPAVSGQVGIIRVPSGGAVYTGHSVPGRGLRLPAGGVAYGGPVPGVGFGVNSPAGGVAYGGPVPAVSGQVGIIRVPSGGIVYTGTVDLITADAPTILSGISVPVPTGGVLYGGAVPRSFTYCRKNLAVANSLGTGKDQALSVGFSLEVLQALINQVDWSLSVYQKVINLLSRGDHIAANLKGLIPLPDTVDARQQLISSLSDSVAVLQKQLNTLSDDPVTAYQQLIQTIAENNDIYALQKIGLALDDPAARFFSTTAEIYLDGRPLSSRMIRAEIVYDENNVHNSLTIPSTDPELFDWADPEIQYGEPRIEVQVGTRLMYFIIDTRPGERSDFVINCLSVSAKEDGPFCAEMDFQLETPTLASEIADSLTHYCPVDWQAPDWVVPVDFGFSGYPLDGIGALAAEIGAVVRCQDDGSLLVRKRRPVRPIDMDAADPAVDYTRSELIALSHAEERESGYNAVEVISQVADVFIPQMMLEAVEDGPAVGQTVYVRVYWAGNPVTVDHTYITSGRFTRVASTSYDQPEEAIVEFKDGKASVPLPINSLISWEWIGAAGGTISYDRFGTDLLIANNAFRVAKIKYTSAYQRYVAEDHEVEQLICVLFLDPAADIRSRVRTIDEPVWAPEITAPLLTDDNAATQRAMAAIDAMKYPRSIISVEAPYEDAAVDGALAFINDDQIGYPGNHHITSSKIIFDGPKITNQLGTEKCLISFSS